MIIKYLSDLHLEFGNEIIEDYYDLSNNNVDVVVIAGDISVAKKNHLVLRKLAVALDPIPVLYVPGNHDFYHGSKPTVHRQLLKLDNDQPNFHYLNRSTFILDNVVFIGATGWQDDPNYNEHTFYMMNDFHLIKGHNTTVNRFGRDDKKFIIKSLESYKDLNRVVITHTIPTKLALNFGTYEVEHKKRYLKAYYNEWDDILTTYKPDIWICGHCHDSFFEIVYDTIIVRNALGYKYTDRENRQFDKHSLLYV